MVILVLFTSGSNSEPDGGPLICQSRVTVVSGYPPTGYPDTTVPGYPGTNREARGIILKATTPSS
eukprot:157231-Rhodomonas_salina.1